MDAKGKERGILKLEPRPRVIIDPFKYELTPQGSCEHGPSSPQPSVDRLSVTWADPGGSMTSSGVNLFHLPSETPVVNEVKFSTSAGDGSEDEDYSASLSAVLRQRRASVRRSRKGRTRRPSSPFLPDENRPRRRSSVFTTSSGDTAISIEEAPTIVTQEQIFENIHLHKEVLGSVKQQPLGMRRKLKIVHQAKGYIKRHEGQLQERLAQSKSTRDIYARFNILIAAKWQQMKREAANTSNLLIPWELRIKEIESHFGSVVASYFTFLRWLFWVNLVIGFILLVFVIVPECLTANPEQDGGRKTIMEEERPNATNLLTLWEFEGVLKFSPIFYGYYSNIERVQYRMPLAYFLTGLVVYIYSFVAILRKMAENSRMSKLSEKEDECIFSWKLFTGWDFMIGNAETAHNRIASVILGFKEALLEEAEKKKDLRNWRIISLRAIVNICVIVLLAVSAYAVVHVVSRSDDSHKYRSWWRENETTVVVTVISITFPVFFELLGLLEHYHPRKQLRLQLARIMLLNLLNLYSLIFALFSKIEGMSNDLDQLKPNLSINGAAAPEYTLHLNETYLNNVSIICIEVTVPCEQCALLLPLTLLEIESPSAYSSKKILINSTEIENLKMIPKVYSHATKLHNVKDNLIVRNLEKYDEKTEESAFTDPTVESTTADITAESTTTDTTAESTITDITVESTTADTTIESTTADTAAESTTADTTAELTTADTTVESTTASAVKKELERLRNLAKLSSNENIKVENDSVTETDNDDYNFYDDNSTTDINLDTSSFSTSFSSSYDYESGTEKSIITKEYYSTSTTEIMSFSAQSNEKNTLATNEIITDLTDISTEGILNTSIDQVIKLNTDLGNESTMKEIISTDSSILIDDTLNNYMNVTTPDFVSIETNMSYFSTNPVLYSTNNSYETTSNKAVTGSTLFFTEQTTLNPVDVSAKLCPNLSFNCSVSCGKKNITQVFNISNCTIKRVCYEKKCNIIAYAPDIKNNQTNMTMVDKVYIDDHNIKQYNLTIPTRKKLLKLCWETMFGQELVKLTMMDLVFVLLGTLFMDFFRALFVRYMNRCWCWDLEKKFPEYGDFKIAENILHLINNQGMVWMGMFFSPGLVVLNVVKLMIMMYLRSWAVMTCNVPHEVVFRVSKSNNFYLALLLTMLFLCVLPVGYTIVCVKPSWHCGPFSEYDRIYYILTNNIYKILPKSLNFTLGYIASPAIVIPLLVLLILIIYYLTSLTNSLREANNDLKIQLRRERTEERRKMFQLADTRRRAGSSAMDNTPFARWKKALPSLPLSKSIDSDDRKTVTGDETIEPLKTTKKKGSIFAKIVNMALDNKSDESPTTIEPSPFSYNIEDETDTEFHESLPKEILKIKDITITKNIEHKKKNNVEFKTDDNDKTTSKHYKSLKKTLEGIDNHTEKIVVVENEDKYQYDTNINKSKSFKVEEDKKYSNSKTNQKQMSESSTQSKQSDSIGSVIPVIMISTTESDEEVLHTNKRKRDTKTKEKKHKEYVRGSRAHNEECEKKIKKYNTDTKPLRRQSSVDSIKGQKILKETKVDEGHKYQYSL